MRVTPRCRITRGDSRSLQGRKVAIEATGQRELVKGGIRSSVVLVVLVVPLLVACWLVSARRPIGQGTLGMYIAAVVLLIACEHWLSFDDKWGSALRGSWTDFLYVAVASLMDKVTF